MHKIIESEPNLWTVGYHDPDNKWIACQDFDDYLGACGFCSWLNGGLDPELVLRLKDGFKIGGAFNRRP